MLKKAANNAQFKNLETILPYATAPWKERIELQRRSKGEALLLRIRVFQPENQASHVDFLGSTLKRLAGKRIAVKRRCSSALFRDTICHDTWTANKERPI